MRLREAVVTAPFSHIRHLILGAVTEVLYLLAPGLATIICDKRFRIHSIETFVVLPFFCMFILLETFGVPASQPTPLISVREQFSIGACVV